MKKIFTLITCTLILISFAQSAWAQGKLPGSKVTGKIVDEQQKPLDFATVSLLRAKDSSLVKSALSDQNGTYVIELIAAGDYLITASVVGYKKAYTKRFVVDPANLVANLAPLILPLQSKSLKEIAVVAQKPLVERKMDRLILNVEGNSIAAGGTAMEVLEKAPGVTIDRDDNISMKGKQGVLIMIDGKQTYMSSADVANMLRSMQSSEIESIELITSPSAKYDAAGTSGIINIKTKKNKSLGLNGSLTFGSGYGQTSKYSTGTILNYRGKKFNFFGNYTYGNNGRVGHLDMIRKVIYKDTTTNFIQNNRESRRRQNNSYKAGADFFINKNHTIGVLINGYANSNNEQTSNLTFWKNNFSDTEYANAQGTIDANYHNNAYNFNYKGTLGKAGSELTVDFDYSRYKGTENEIRNNTYVRSINLTPRAPGAVNNNSPAIIKVRSAKADLTHPLGKTAKLQAGLKTSFVTSDNDLLFARMLAQNWVADPNYTNHFIYDENINAAYLNFSKEFKKTGFQFGLRAEQTTSKGNSITKNETVKRNYIEFFPSVSVSQKLDKNNDLGLSLSRRIDRPGYDDLNPFLNFLDEYTFQKGNPYLNPQFSSSVDFSHTYKGKITTSISYSRTVDVMTTVTEQDDQTKRTFAIKRNLDKQTVLGLNIYAPVPITKWWNVNNNFQAYRMGFKSELNGSNLNAAQNAMTYNMDHSFSFSKTFGADLSARYQSPLTYGIFMIKSQVIFNAGLKKSFLNNKLNLRLNLNDVFNDQRNRVSTTYQNMDLSFTEKSESRIGRISLTYRFGKNEIKPSRKRTTGLEEEQNRMKN